MSMAADPINQPQQTHLCPMSGPAYWAQAINFIKEDDGGLGLLSFLKQQPQLALGLAHPLG